MKQYLLSVHMVEGRSPSARPRMMQAGLQRRRRLQRRTAGRGRLGVRRRPPPADHGDRGAVRDGEVLTTDGPFAETKEQLGGFWVIAAPDLDAALAWAAQGPRACGGPVEVRPFQR